MKPRLTPQQVVHVLGLWDGDELREYLSVEGWTQAEIAALAADVQGHLYAALERYGARREFDPTKEPDAPIPPKWSGNPCTFCGGTGHMMSPRKTTCRVCGGTGKLP